MKYPLHIVLWVRRRAEDRAMHLWQAAKAEEERARADYKQKQEDLVAFREACEQAAEQWFANVQGKPIAHRDILQHREQMKWDAEAVARKEREVTEAANLLKNKEVATAKAMSEYQAAAREVMKLEQHETAWKEEARREEEFVAENEIEEAAEGLYAFRNHSV